MTNIEALLSRADNWPHRHETDAFILALAEELRRLDRENQHLQEERDEARLMVKVANDNLQCFQAAIREHNDICEAGALLPDEYVSRMDVDAVKVFVSDWKLPAAIPPSAKVQSLYEENARLKSENETLSKTGPVVL